MKNIYADEEKLLEENGLNSSVVAFVEKIILYLIFFFVPIISYILFPFSHHIIKLSVA